MKSLSMVKKLIHWLQLKYVSETESGICKWNWVWNYQSIKYRSKNCWNLSFNRSNICQNSKLETQLIHASFENYNITSLFSFYFIFYFLSLANSPKMLSHCDNGLTSEPNGPNRTYYYCISSTPALCHLDIWKYLNLRFLFYLFSLCLFSGELIF